MILSWNVRWSLLYLTIFQINLGRVQTSWPSSKAVNIEVLGLFPSTGNASETTELSAHSFVMFKAAMLLAQQYNFTLAGEPIGWQTAATGGSGIDALSAACQAVSTSNIVGIVGPAFSRVTRSVAEFAERTGMPVISYAATDPELSNRNTYPTLYRTASSDSAAATAIAKLFARFNWTSCVIIYQNDAFGSGGAKVINEAFLHSGITVRDQIAFDITTRRFRGDLRTYLTASATRLVVLWAQATYASQILQNALDSKVLGPDFTWILSSSVPLSSFNETFHPNLVGILTVEPVVRLPVDVPSNATLLDAAYALWKQYEPESFPGPTKVNTFALFAFDATWALIRSLQHLCSTTQKNVSPCLSVVGSSYCFNRRLVRSKLLLDALSSTDFLGVSGPVRFNANVTDRTGGSYYSVQNVQPSPNGVSFSPVLEYADAGGWRAYAGANVIVWPGNSLAPSRDRTGLSGVTVRIAVIESNPYTFVTIDTDASGRQTARPTGYMPELIEHLRNKMGFMPIIQLAPANQTYAAVIQGVANGVYDMLVADITITAKRRESVGFSNAIFDNAFRLIMRETPSARINYLSFLKPFSYGLWLALLGASVLAAIVLCLLERAENAALQERSILSTGVMSIWFAVGTIMGYGADFHVQTAAGRLFTVGLYMLSLVLVASYTANLASDLTISKSRNSISGINDLRNGKVPFGRIGVRVGTSGEDFYLREISGGVRNFFPLKSRQEAIDNLLSGAIDVSYMDTGPAEYITNTVYCNLTLIGEGFNQGALGIVVPKQWQYLQDLDVNILSLRESGVLDELKRKWFQAKQCPQSTETSSAMGIESMVGLFLIFGVITVMSLLVFLWKTRGVSHYCLSVLKLRRKSLLAADTYSENL